MAPTEEPFDGRNLYDRLKEQKDAKDMEFEESRKLKNLIRGLDDDECKYLDEVDQKRAMEDRMKFEEEKIAMQEYREKVSILEREAIDVSSVTRKQKPKPKGDTTARPLSQKEILSSVIKRKSTTETFTTEVQLQKKVKSNSNEEATALVPHALLPGLGNYDSSDSDDSSELSDSDCQQRSDIDWMGRKIVKVSKGCDE